MLTFDRYLLRFFIKVLLICLVSITGLYIVIDVFNNLDEFLGYGREEGSLLAVLVDYYGARVPWFFNMMSPLLTLIAAVKCGVKKMLKARCGCVSCTVNGNPAKAPKQNETTSEHFAIGAKAFSLNT